MLLTRRINYSIASMFFTQNATHSFIVDTAVLSTEAEALGGNKFFFRFVLFNCICKLFVIMVCKLF